MRGLGCSDQEIELVRRRDWQAMMEHGGSIYLLLKIGAAVGHALPQIGAHTSGPERRGTSGAEGTLSMATVIGGIGTSHAPTIGVAWDKGQQQEPMWAPLFNGYLPARQWLEEVRPDLFLIVYNDHVNQFFFDAYPTFALGVGAVHAQADEGWGKRALPDLPGDPDFAWHLARSLVDG